jgi:hypothetical protein
MGTWFSYNFLSSFEIEAKISYHGETNDST